MQFHQNTPSREPVKLIALGGFGKVTSNMFVYEQDNDILLVDCGMGFPTEDMLGVDLLIPDISYLRPKFNKIRGLVYTHGHEDHTGATPYILQQLPKIPLYASRLTAHLLMEKLADYANLPQQVNILVPGTPLKLGSFTIESIRVSHSIPDATHLLISTKYGNIYHGSDFKFDFTPVDGVQPDVGRIAKAGTDGVKLLLSDSLGSERKGFTPSEKSLEDTFETAVSQCKGKFIVTSMSSNISRWYQAATAAIRHGRRIAVSGRSIQRNLEVAGRLGIFKLPPDAFVELKSVKKLTPKNVSVLVAGIQGQTGSAMERLATGEHSDLEVTPGDTIMFSSDYIPGSETAVQSLIDTLSKQGAEVIYSGIMDHLHVSGHGSQQDMTLLLGLAKPQYVLPIGGTYRHMVQYAKLASSMGFAPDHIMLPDYNQIIEIYPDTVKLGAKTDIKSVMVDGLGVGDVGAVVLRDRQHLAEEGVVVAIAEFDQNDYSKLINLELISRGFVFDKHNANLLASATSEVKKVFFGKLGKVESERHARLHVSDTLEKYFFQSTRRRPMILPIIVSV